MRLKNILSGVDIVKCKNFKNYNITNITHIAGEVDKAGIFIAVKGNNFDGNSYIETAIKNGAKCIITETENCVSDRVCIIVVKDVRLVMSIVAKNFYNRCVDTMKVIGVVGTSGKTTTSIMISQLLKSSGKKVGTIGTNGVFIDNIQQKTHFTTPDPLELHYIFYQMKCLGVEVVVMEVSAQAIYYKKLFGIKFDICVFTNISREHLDFFGSMEEYVRCKMNFFNKENMRECVVNVDDFYGRELAYKLNIPCVSYGINEPANSFAIDINLEFARTKFVANILDDVFDIDSIFVGMFNVSNLIAALTVVKMLGLKTSEIIKAVSNLKAIDGRYNVYDINGKKIIIDFAHTPKSIENLLAHIKSTSNYNIISLFGCVGYSDKDKRQEMASVVKNFSDKVIVTTDNRGCVLFEDISKDIVEALDGVEYECIEDRECAIRYGYELMGDNDVLVLIGKGAEDFQTIENERVPYSDKECVVKLMLGLV